MTMDNRYEEALKRAKQEYNTTKNVERKQLLEEYFPEIKGSEDERIREEIKVILANTDFSQFALDFTFADMINWLEKQSKKQTYQSNERAWLYLVADVLTWREGIGQYLDDPRVQELAKKMQKEYSQKLHVEKQVDDVKPKFKIGDWIVNDYCMGRVVELTNDAYLLDTEQGIPFSCEHNVHLWTIQDAKDGDVLFAENFGNIGGCVFLFNSIDNREFYEGDDMKVATGYCCIDITESGNTDFGIQGPDCIDIERVHPATKEQRDLLFQKIEESGYDFDFEKKEFKKIEEDDLTEFENALADVCRGWTGEEHGWKDYIIKNSFPLLALAKKQFDEYEKKHVEWSKEDEKMLHTIIADFKGFRHDNTSTLEYHFTECIDWLKSLKDRVQPKQKWSDEDFKRIDYICDFIWKNRKGDTDEIYQQEQDVKWLKSLKDRVQYQSKEQSEEDEYYYDNENQNYINNQNKYG